MLDDVTHQFATLDDRVDPLIVRLMGRAYLQYSAYKIRSDSFGG